MSNLVEIDGSYGEGGGQVLRTSLSLAAITGQAVEIRNVRAGRAKPGLKAQHLASVHAAAAVCSAKLRGDAVGSMYLFFEPAHPTVAGDYHFEIGTAGSTTLVAQTLIVPLALAEGPSSVTVVGGTHNPMAPTADYLEHVYSAMLRTHGLAVETSYGPPGFNPTGGGKLQIDVKASKIEPFLLLKRLSAPVRSFVTTSLLPSHVADRAELMLQTLGNVHKRCDEGLGAGAAVTIAYAGAGFSSLGERGKPMERVVQEAIDEAGVWSASAAAVDEHLADQLVLPAFFASGESTWRTNQITEHLRTVLWVASQFIPVQFQIDEANGTVVLQPGG